MFVTWEAVNHRHPNTDLYARGSELKQQRLEEEEARVGSVAAFRSYGHTLETVTHLFYIGRILTMMDDDCL